MSGKAKNQKDKKRRNLYKPPMIETEILTNIPKLNCGLTATGGGDACVAAPTNS